MNNLESEKVFFGKTTTVFQDNNSQINIKILTTKKELIVLTITQTQLELLMWRFYRDPWGSRSQRTKFKNGHSYFKSLSVSKIIDICNSEISKYSRELRFVSKGNKYIICTTKHYVSLTFKGLKQHSIQLLSSLGLLDERDDTLKTDTSDNIMFDTNTVFTLPLIIQNSKINEGEKLFLIVDTGNNLYSNCIKIMLGLQVSQQYGMIFNNFNCKYKIHRYVPIESRDNTEKTKIFYRRYKKILSKILDNFSNEKTNIDILINVSKSVIIPKLIQKQFINKLTLSKYIKKQIIEKIETDSTSLWDMSVCISWISNNSNLRSKTIIHQLQLLSTTILYDKYLLKYKHSSHPPDFL